MTHALILVSATVLSLIAYRVSGLLIRAVVRRRSAVLRETAGESAMRTSGDNSPIIQGEPGKSEGEVVEIEADGTIHPPILPETRAYSREVATELQIFTPQKIRLIMSVLVSIVLLGAALFIILSKNYDGGAEKFAYGVVGTIIGFWLKPGD